MDSFISSVAVAISRIELAVYMQKTMLFYNKGPTHLQRRPKGLINLYTL